MSSSNGWGPLPSATAKTKLQIWTRACSHPCRCPAQMRTCSLNALHPQNLWRGVLRIAHRTGPPRRLTTHALQLWCLPPSEVVSLLATHATASFLRFQRTESLSFSYTGGMRQHHCLLRCSTHGHPLPVSPERLLCAQTILKMQCTVPCRGGSCRWCSSLLLRVLCRLLHSVH